MRYVFKAVDIVVSIVFLALCAKAFCIHFYQDIKRQPRAQKLPTIKNAPSLGRVLINRDSRAKIGAIKLDGAGAALLLNQVHGKDHDGCAGLVGR